MARANKNIKKLSEAIVNGCAIAEEKGIKAGKGGLVYKDDKGNLCACTLGMALIGIVGVREAAKMLPKGSDGYSILDKHFTTTKTHSDCLGKTEEYKRATRGDGYVIGRPTLQNFVVTVNDNTGNKPKTIAKILDSCGF